MSFWIRAQIKTLKESLVHAVGASDYVPFQEVLQLRRAIDGLEVNIPQLTEQLAASEAKANELEVSDRMARRWAVEMGRDFAEEIEFQKELDMENRGWSGSLHRWNTRFALV